MKKVLLFWALATGLLMIVHNISLDGMDGMIWSIIHAEDTKYAPGYTDSGFRKVRIGASKNDVMSILGTPLRSRTYEDEKEYWYYSASPGDTHYRIRVIVFSKEGRVIRKASEFYVD